MVAYTYSKLPTANFNTTPPSIARSAPGSVYDVGDTGFTTPLNMTMVVGGAVVTTISSNALGFLPDFTLDGRVSCVWKQTGATFATVLTTSDPIPGPPGPNTIPTDTAIASNITTAGTATAGALNATYARKQAFDVKAYGAKGDGSTDDITAITNAINDAVTAVGGIVYFPAGTYRISASIPTHSGIVYQGAGRSFTTIKPYQSAAFTGSGTISAPIADAEWRDMTWDGANITVSGYKGQYSAYMIRCKWTNVRCINFTATGFGSDYLVDCVYERCTASYNGRLSAIDGPGMSGFGIGTGAYQVENTILKGCSAMGNTNYGIFFERQPNAGAFNSYGVQVIGCYLDGNGYGLGGCGVDSPVYSGNIIRASVRDGIIIGAGTGASPLGMPDKRATIAGNQIFGNGRDGIRLEVSKNSIPAAFARHIISNNNVRDNTGNGLYMDTSIYASDVVRGVKIADNKFTGNGGDGIFINQAANAAAGVYIADLHLENNDIADNTGSAIHVAAFLTRPVIRDNNCYDDQATKTQSYGILIDPTFILTDATIKDNNLLSNKTAATSWDAVANFAGDSSARGNRGYNPGWASITVGASPFSYTCGITPEIVYWAGGSTSAVKITPKGSTQATVLLVSGAETIPLLPGDAVEFTYTAGPTSLKTIKQQ